MSQLTLVMTLGKAETNLVSQRSSVPRVDAAQRSHSFYTLKEALCICGVLGVQNGVVLE